MNKGTEFDKLCHKLFAANDAAYHKQSSGLWCGKCGYPLSTYYAESRLYLVGCEHCKVKALVEADSPAQACYKTMAYPVYAAADAGEEDALYFAVQPIAEPPCYIGSPICSDFPDDVKLAMDLPIPATDGSEIKIKEV